MRTKEYLISRLVALFGFSTIADYVYAFLSIGYPSGASVPKVLMDFNILNIVRGLFTRFVVSTNLDWIWPFWMEKQFYATNNDFAARGFNPASINTSNRNWTGIGDLNSEYESTVDPRGLITPYYNGWSLDCWVQLGEEVYSPAKIDKVQQSLYKNLPVVVTEYSIKEKIQIKQTAFVKENEQHDSIAYQKVELTNTSKSVVHAYFAFAFRPYNTEGISLINELRFKETGEVFINNQLAAVLMNIPNGINTSSLSKGDVHHYFDEAKNNKIFDQRKSRVGMATGITVYNLELSPGQTVEYEIRMPNNVKQIKKNKKNKRLLEFTKRIRGNTFSSLFTQFCKEWDEKLDQGMKITVPDETIQNCFDANKAFMLMFYDNTYITPGPSTYHEFWFRDATYLLNGLDKLGYHQETRNILNTYKHRIHASGFFYSQAGEWDSNGQAIWSIMEHYRLTKDKSIIKENYGIINRGAQWITYKANSNLKTDPGYRGLMPPGLSAEHFGLNDYYYWDDFWSLAGLRDAIEASDILGKRYQSQKIEKGYKKLYNDVDISLQYAEARLGRPIMPISPSRRMDSAAVGCIASYYPCRIYKAGNIRLLNTIKFLHEKCFIHGGFFHDVNHSGHGTYLTMHIAQCYLGIRSAKALEILDWLLSVASKTYSWPEAIHPRTLGGTIGDGHHGWAAADIVLLIRNMLFMEEDNNLVITPVIPKKWLNKGKTIAVNKAPTYFGSLSYTIECLDKKNLILKLKPTFTTQPKQIEWCLPGNILKAAADKKEININENKVFFTSKTKEVRITLK